MTDKTSNGTSEVSLWANPEKDFLLKMRRIFDKTDLSEIKQSLIKYAEMIELTHCRFPDMGPVRADWAVAMALSPEWYGGELATRLQNSMLVSALLLTVTSTMFISPPLANFETIAFRVLIYFTGICNMLFIMSIMLGIFFIENAMSRAYGESERFVLIIEFYLYKDLSQIFMAVGSALFPILLAIPMWEIFKHIDANILIAFTTAYVVAFVYVMGSTTAGAKREQMRRLGMFQSLIDPQTQRLLPRYYPDDAEMQPEDYRQMYSMAQY